MRPFESIPFDQGFSFLATGAGTNTKTSWTDVSGPDFDTDGFWLTIVGTSSAVADHLVDIGYGNTGDAVDVTLISNFLFSGGATFGTAVRVYVPLAIPAGERVAWRHQSSDGSSGLSMQLKYEKGGGYASQRLMKATTYGANTADSGGTSVDPGGSANSKGLYANLGAISAAHTYIILCLGTQNNATRTQANHFFDVACGTDIYCQNLFALQTAGVDLFLPGAIPGFVDPMVVGANMQVRHSSSITDATDRLADAVVIGFD